MDLARLGLDERAARLSEQQAAMISAVLIGALERCRLGDRLAVRRALAEELRAVDEAGRTGSRSTSGGSRRGLAKPVAYP